MAEVIREAAQEDAHFLVEMAALFGQTPPDAPSVRDWMLPEWDAGYIAEAADHTSIGAAWWRPFRGVMEGDELNPELRELFLAVAAGHRDNGTGGRLFDMLVQRARGELGIGRLIGRVVAGEHHDQVREMLRRRGFAENRSYVSRGAGPFWVLDCR